MGSTAQTKAGNLIIEGVLRLGQFATAPSGTEGALYFDTTEKKMKVYSNSAWGDLGGGVPGLLPSYTTTQRDALSPTTGQQIYNTTENKVQVYGSGNWIAVSAKLALAATCSLDGDCDSTHCVDGYCCDTACSGTVCQTCGSLSSAGLGHCGYVNSSSQDPRNTCATTGCYTGTCNGNSYACGYYTSGDANCPICQTCVGTTSGDCLNYAAYTEDVGCTTACHGCSGGSCINIPDASQDTWGTNLCNTVHNRCTTGVCTTATCTGNTCVTRVAGQSCTTTCANAGYCGCYCILASNCSSTCQTAQCGLQDQPKCLCQGWTY